MQQPVEVNHPAVDPEAFLIKLLRCRLFQTDSPVYTVTTGKEQFGEQVVLKWSGNTVSVFTSKMSDIL
jgi:hypothetical protein